MSLDIDSDVGAGSSPGTTIVPASKGRARRMFWPVTGVTVLAGATAYLATVNPNQPGHYPICPLKYATGIDCPACGGLRCVYDLAHGDVAGALDQNLLAVVLLPLFVVWMFFALRRRWNNEPKLHTQAGVRRQRCLLIGLMTVAVVFAVVRNLPFVPFLGSGLG